MILSIPSFARNVYTHPDPAYVQFDMSKNPIKRVKSLSMGHITLPKSEFNVVNARTLTFKVVATNQTFTVTLEPDFLSLQTLLTKLAAAMTTNSFTVNFSINNSGKVTVQTSTEMQFFSDLPTTGKSEDIWKYVESSFIRVLGFNLTAPTSIQGNSPFTCPNIVDLQGRDYVFMQMKVNDVLVGNTYEMGTGGIRFGPFFGKIELTSEPGDVTFSPFNSGSHSFLDETTISSISIEIMGPIVGNKLSRYDLNLRDWTLSLIIEQPNETSVILPAPTNLSEMQLSINSKDRDVFDRVPVFPPAPTLPPQSTAQSIRDLTTVPSNPSYFSLDFSKNPLKNIKSIRLGDTWLWKTTETREIQWSWFSDLAGIFKSDTVYWHEQTDESTLLARLSAIMSDTNYGGKTVTWSVVNSKATITTNEKLILFTPSPVPTGHFILSHNT